MTVYSSQFIRTSGQVRSSLTQIKRLGFAVWYLRQFKGRRKEEKGTACATSYLSYPEFSLSHSDSLPRGFTTLQTTPLRFRARVRVNPGHQCPRAFRDRRTAYSKKVGIFAPPVTIFTWDSTKTHTRNMNLVFFKFQAYF